MDYEVKDFRVEGSNKYVGLIVTDPAGHSLLIDKQIPIESGKSDDYYIEKAIEVSESIVTEWQEEFAVVGKKFNTTTKRLE